MYNCMLFYGYIYIYMVEENTLKKKPIKRQIPEGTQGKTGHRLDLLRIICLPIYKKRRNLA